MDSEIDLLEKFVLSEDKASLLSLFPSNSNFKSLMSLYSQIDDPNFLDLLNSAHYLDYNSKRQLRLLHSIKSIRSDPKSIQTLKKELLGGTNYSAPTQLRDKFKSTLPSQLDPSFGTINFDQYAKDLREFQKLTLKGKFKVKIEDMNDEVFNDFVKVGIIAKSMPGFVAKVLKGLEDKKKNQKSFIDMLSLDQLEEVQKNLPELVHVKDFVIAKVKAGYNFDNMKEDEKYVVLNQLYEFAKVTKIPEFFAAVLIGLIAVGSRLRVFEEQFLMEYFACHRSSSFYKENNGLNEGILNEFLNLLPKAPAEPNLLTDYFESILPSKETYESILYPIKPEEAKKYFSRAKLLSGADPALFKDYLSQSDLIDVEKSVELSLLTNNAEVFATSDLVKLSLKLKNIKDLTVRVIEINGKNFSLSASPTLDFDGLAASEETHYQYNHSSFTRHYETFEFPSLTKPGIFYIEFIGKGLRTSALIRKGSLKCVFKTTVAGQALTILDENNEVVKKGGVYLDNSFIELGEKTYLIIPFSNSPSSKRLVITDGEIYSETSFYHLSADYRLSCAYLLNEEQLIYGNSTDVWIHPVVFVHDAKCEGFLVSEFEATLSTRDVEGQSSSKHFSRLEYSNSPVKLSFNVPPRIQNCSVKVRVVLKINGEEKVLTDEKNFAVNQILASENLLNLYIRKNTQGYYIQAKGRNGEPWSNLQVNISLRSKYVNKPFESYLSTDNTGTINLGHLKSFTEISVSADGNFNTVTKNLSQYKTSQNFPSQVVICENDEYTLPLSVKPSKPLHKIACLYEETKKSFKFVPISFNPEVKTLIIKNLEKGQYKLHLLQSSTTISLSVIDGSHFPNLDYVLTQSQVFNTQGQFNYFSITSAESSASQIKLKLSGSIENSTAYVLYSNLLPNQEFAFELFKLHPNVPASQFNFQGARNEFYEARKLGDEYSYVINRKRQNKFVGNTLPRPQVLMKRMILSETSTAGLVGLGGMAPKSCMQRFAENRMMADMLRSECLIKDAFYADFLAKPARWEVLKVVGNELVVEVDGDFSNVSIYIDNGRCVASYLATVDSNLKTRDLTVASTLSSSKNYIEKNLLASLATGQEFTIKNSENSFEIIDSIEKLYNLLKEIHKVRHLNDWSFLSQWHTLSNTQKLEKLDKFFSFELNLFIYHKDRQFFDEVIKPFISCKLEKTLIDNYFLGESLEKYEDQYHTLNYLEQTLYALSLISQESPQGKVILESFKSLAEAQPVPSNVRAKVYSKVFQSSKAAEAPKIPVSEQYVYGSPPPPPPCSGAPMGMGMAMCSGPPPPPPGMSQSSLRRACLDEKMSESRPAPKMFMSMCMAREEAEVSLQSMNYDMDFIPQSEILQTLSKPAYFQKMESTKKYEETGYYDKDSALFIPGYEVGFWKDVIDARVGKKEVLTENSLFAGSNLMSLIAVLAFSDLPLEPSSHLFVSEGKSIKIQSASNLMVFYKDLAEEENLNTGKILSAHQYCKRGDNKSLASLARQYLYECKLVLTNITPDRAELEVLTILPEGSMPILPPLSMKNNILTLNGYSTSVINYSFYFPNSGKFEFIPASISEQGKVISSALTSSPEVLESERIDKVETFFDVVCMGEDQKILDFVREKNIYKDVNLEIIYFKLVDKEFWTKLIEILEQKNHNDEVVSSFSLFHEDIDRTLKHLKKNINIQNTLSYMWEDLNKPLPHFEFSPLVNARAYQLGTQKRIANPEILHEYKSLLQNLAFKSALSLSDKLRICQYMLYKDDLSKAKSLFDVLSKDFSFSLQSLNHSNLQIQLDYLRAYFYPEDSLSISSLYLNYPVLSWRKKFSDLHQISIEASAVQSPESSIKVQDHPALSFTVEDSIIYLNYSSLDSCSISLFPIDLEVIFSLNPELDQNNLNFSCSKPSKTVNLALTGNGKFEYKLDDELSKQNLVVEVEFAGMRKSLIVFSSDLKFLVFENQGVVKVMDKKGRPRPAAYVKAFVKRAGKGNEFYKDGFTDVRGKFDYASIANSDLPSLEKFLILICDDELGALVLSAKPPAQ